MTEPLPLITPMLATTGQMPTTDEQAFWAYEMKWDGVRAVALVGGGVRLYARSGREITANYPELAALGEVLEGRRLVLDGEIVAFDDEGRVSFAALQPRIHGGPKAGRPIAYLVFDVLYDDGVSLLNTSYEERRETLEALGLQGANWQTPPVFAGVGETARQVSVAQGLEGVVAKRLDSRYLPGQRSQDWIKVKNILTQEVVICGWRTGRDSRASTFGSLLCGVHDSDGRLRYVGRVGSGFTGQLLVSLHSRLLGLRRTTPAVEDVPPPDTRDAHWVEPVLVAEVVYAGWTSDGRLWHPRWRALRDDKNPRDVVRES